MKWIKCTDKIPEYCDVQLVLCVGANKGMFVGYIMGEAGEDGKCYCQVPNARGGRNATHWMPLPEPPTADQPAQKSCEGCEYDTPHNDNCQPCDTNFSNYQARK